jgi:hypothetical protein
MKNQKVVSREYKVMLKPDRFKGNEAAVKKAATAFWTDFERGVADVVRGTAGALGKVGARRLITFFDTGDRSLNESGYIFRERRDAGNGGGREVTLKFRHADRHVAQDRDMRARRMNGARTKFEEDIKPPFASLYSYSTTIPVRKRWSAGTMADARRLFPDIRRAVDTFNADQALAPVGGFTAREVVLEGGTFGIGKKPKVEAECALIVWYDEAKPAEKPVAVEFSYRYGDKREDYRGVMARRAFDVFNRMSQLREWVDPHPRTKTAFVYR